MLFPWCIDKTVTNKSGDIEFSIRFYRVDTINKTFIYNLNTLPAKSKVLKGLDGHFYEEDADRNVTLSSTEVENIYTRLAAVEKDGKIFTVQCKFTASANWEINMRSMGGTNGSVYDNVLNHPLDILFCANEKGEMYVIPMDDLRKAGNTKSITLRNKSNSNNQGFNTYNYLVSL